MDRTRPGTGLPALALPICHRTPPGRGAGAASRSPRRPDSGAGTTTIEPHQYDDLPPPVLVSSLRKIDPSAPQIEHELFSPTSREERDRDRSAEIRVVPFRPVNSMFCQCDQGIRLRLG